MIEIAPTPEEVRFLREAKKEVDQLSNDLGQPKAAVSVAKEKVKKRGLHRGAFDVSRRYANKKLPEAQAFFRDVQKCALAWGIFDQGDVVELANAATAKAAPVRRPARGRRASADDRPAA